MVGNFDLDKVVVNGIELTVESRLAELKAACAFLRVSRSGGKAKCYARLVSHMKQEELKAAREAADAGRLELHREPHGVPVTEAPSQAIQDQHALTHVPYTSHGVHRAWHFARGLIDEKLVANPEFQDCLACRWTTATREPTQKTYLLVKWRRPCAW